jgi:hypothetical protein
MWAKLTMLLEIGDTISSFICHLEMRSIELKLYSRFLVSL